MDRRERHFERPDFDPKAMTIVVAIRAEGPDGEDVETFVKFPAHFTVCGTCEGRGTHVNPSIDSNGISEEDFEQDPDFRESYFAGRYDVTCVECGGKRVTPAINHETLSPAQAADFAAYVKAEDARAADEAADERTYRMECGYY